jgi:MATE family multidrug resistance protein
MPNLSNLPHRRAWHLAWPLMLSNLTTPLMGLADTAMLGHQNDSAYLAAVAIGANVLTFSLWMFGFLRMGTTSLTGQALGAQQPQQMKLLLYRGLLMGAILGLVLIIVQFLLLPYILQLMTPDAALRELAWRYCLIRLSAAPAVLMTYAAVGWFIGLQQSRKPLLITLVVNGINLLLDWWLILVLGWGSDGAALASACAEYLGLLIVVVLILRQLAKDALRVPVTAQWWAWAGWKPLFRVNRDLFVRTACLLAVFSFFTAQGAHISATVVATNAILLQLLLLASHALDGYAHAAETMVAHATGQRSLTAFRRAGLAAGIASVGLAVLLSAGFHLAQPLLIPALTKLPDLQAGLQEYYAWLVVLPLISVWSYVFDGIFIGSGHTHSLRNWMLAVAGLVFLPLWWATQGWQNHGLWMSFTLFNFARGLSLGLVLSWNLHRRGWWLPRTQPET